MTDEEVSGIRAFELRYRRGVCVTCTGLGADGLTGPIARYCLILPWYNLWRGKYDRILRPVCVDHFDGRPIGVHIGEAILTRYAHEPMCSVRFCQWFQTEAGDWMQSPLLDLSGPHEHVASR